MESWHSYYFDKVVLPFGLALSAANLATDGWNWFDGSAFIVFSVCIIGGAILDRVMEYQKNEMDTE